MVSLSYSQDMNLGLCGFKACVLSLLDEHCPTESSVRRRCDWTGLTLSFLAVLFKPFYLVTDSSALQTLSVPKEWVRTFAPSENEWKHCRAEGQVLHEG